MTHTPTPEQVAIITASQNSNDNLLISALAGAAKTSTLEMIALANPKVKFIYLAFNKRNAEEAQKRLPPNCTASTINSTCHRAWGAALGKRLIVEHRKNYNIVKQIIDGLGRNEKDEAWGELAFILRAIEFGKTMGYVPDGKFDNARPLMSDEELYRGLEEEPSKLAWNIIREASFVSLKQSWQGMIDFSDQILMCGVFPVTFSQDFDTLLTDESQDFSVLNHVIVGKIVRRKLDGTTAKRLVSVGDDCQSIYAFRGAHPGSMDLLKRDFAMREFTLSTSFRCPDVIVREAQWRAPHMKWWKEGGTVKTLGAWSVDDLPDTVTIVCRNNAPLFSMAFKLIRAGRYPEVVGNDIGKNLVKTLTKFGPKEMPREALLHEIDKWQAVKLTKVRNQAAVYDQAECLRIFAEQGDTLQDAIAYANTLLESHGPVTLMTMHKAKGLEFEHVIILDRHLLRIKESVQEENLLYVGQTRSKNILWYADSEAWTI